MPLRLLPIEDDPHIADLICRLAEDEGFEVCRPRPNESFTSLYDRLPPDVIILDILMPEMDGFEFLQFLGRRRSAARIIILSGDDSYRLMAGKLADGLGLSIEANLRKPFRISELRQTLGHVLQPDGQRVTG